MQWSAFYDETAGRVCDLKRIGVVGEILSDHEVPAKLKLGAEFPQATGELSTERQASLAFLKW